MAPKVVVFEPDSIYRTLTEAILLKDSYKTYFVNSSDECKNVTSEIKPDILIIDINAAKPNNFAIIKELQKLTSAPIVMTAEENIDDHLDNISQLKITIVLTKPIKSSELLRAMKNLLEVDSRLWFGITNYLPDAKKLRSLTLKRSTQVRSCIKSILNEMKAWGFNFNHEVEMDLVWQEILINAVYHSHGYSHEKRERIQIELPDPYRVDVRYAASSSAFGISVRDYMGTLTPSLVIESISKAIEQQRLIAKAAQTGEDISNALMDRGRGIDLIRQLAGEYYFIIDPGNSTEVIIIYDRYYEKDDTVGGLKIFDLSYYLSRG